MVKDVVALLQEAVGAGDAAAALQLAAISAFLQDDAAALALANTAGFVEAEGAYEVAESLKTVQVKGGIVFGGSAVRIQISPDLIQKWLLTAAKMGSAPAMHRLARMLDIPVGAKPYGSSVDLMWLSRSADAGNVEDMIAWARHLQQSDQEAEAEKYLRMAAKGVGVMYGRSDAFYVGGPVEASIELGTLLRDRGSEEAGLWFRHAADAGSVPAAEMAAAWCLENGCVSEGDHRYRILAEQGRRETQRVRGYLESEWKTYRHQWWESSASVGVWKRAMTREMEKATESGMNADAKAWLLSLSEDPEWVPDPVHRRSIDASLGSSDVQLSIFFIGVPASPELPEDLPNNPFPNQNTVADSTSSYMLVDWLARVYVPAWLDLAEHHGDSYALTGLPEIVDRQSLETAYRVILRIQSEFDLSSTAHGRSETCNPNEDKKWSEAAHTGIGVVLRKLGLERSTGLWSETSLKSSERLLYRSWLWIRLVAAVEPSDAREWAKVWDICSSTAYEAMLRAASMFRHNLEISDLDVSFTAEHAVNLGYKQTAEILQIRLNELGI